MADSKSLRAPQDAKRVDVNEGDEVQYWTDRFSVSEDRLREAVKKVGVSVDAVAAELKQ